jgi:uncharacterized protein involved in exopolysaccharide biosynthesis
MAIIDDQVASQTIADLRAENQRLRQDVAMLSQTAGQLHATCERMAEQLHGKAAVDRARRLAWEAGTN